MKYTSKTQLENYLLRNIDSVFDTQIDTWIEAMSQYVSNITNRQFIADDEASERKYDGVNRHKILVDDFVEMEKVEKDGSDVTDDVTIYPANTLPKNILYRPAGWASGTQNVAVTAKWGYSETPPEDIRFATTVLVAGIINNHEKTGKSVVQKRLGEFSVSYKDDKGMNDFDRVMSILNEYKRLYI